MTGRSSRPAGDPGGRGAAPDPAVLAIIAAAAELLVSGPAPAPAAIQRSDSHTVWRFSGRWWAKPTVARRDRPWSAS